MGESATKTSLTTSQRINRCAQQLTDQHGLDGFTMDGLADAAQVSRRTLFNYFPSKVDAVLGDWPDFDADRVATFRSGGPSGDLVLDLRNLVAPLLETHDVNRETITLSRRILVANPRLLGATHLRHESMSAQVVDHIVAREGAAFSTSRAKVAVAILAAVFHSAIDNFLDDGRARPLVHHLDESFSTARSLLGA